MVDAKKMTVEQLRAEVEKIRAERSGKGRIRRAESKSRRISGQMSDKKRKEDAEKVESAEWV
jgi:uncharacterized OsmC-like protein